MNATAEHAENAAHHALPACADNPAHHALPARAGNEANHALPACAAGVGPRVELTGTLRAIEPSL